MDCLRYSSRCTLWRTCAVVLWIWLQALATSCPPLLGWSSVSYVVPIYSCVVNWASSPSYTAFMTALSYLMPAVIILFCYLNIIKVARSHARRIHTLEDSVQRSRNQSSAFSPCNSSHQQCGSLHCPSKLIYHVSGQFISEVSRDRGNSSNPALPDSTTEQSNPSSRRVFLAQGASQPPLQNSQQHQNQYGVVRLFLVVSAFFLCWTPYIGVALVQATETAIFGQSSLVPPSAVTCSYWLVLLNSDVNPLLYALLSKRFQAALQGLKQKLRAQLWSVVDSGGVDKTESEDGRSSEPCTLTTTHPGPTSSSGSSEDSKSSSTVFTVSTEFKHHSDEHLCGVCHPGNTYPPSSIWQDSACDRMVDYLQVPPWPQEGSRRPFSALTVERQTTFFYGQITVRVEHDVC